MGNQTTLMAVPRHPEVPAPLADEIILATVRGSLRTYDGGALLLTTLGVAYLPVPYDAQTWIGVGIGALAGGLGAGLDNSVARMLVEEAGKAVGETVVKQRVVPDRIRASLRRRGSFAAGYAEVVRVAHAPSGWFSTPSLVFEISRSGAVTSYKVSFASAVNDKQAAGVAECVAADRALAEGVWAWEDAMSSLEAERGGSVQPPRLLASDNPLRDLTARADASGLTRAQVVRRAVERHPSFTEFAHCPPTADIFAVFTRS